MLGLASWIATAHADDSGGQGHRTAGTTAAREGARELSEYGLIRTCPGFPVTGGPEGTTFCPVVIHRGHFRDICHPRR